MRYFLTLPLAALALTAVPAMAQDATATPNTATAPTPPATEPMPESTTPESTTEPVADPTAPAPATSDQAVPAPDASTTPTPPTAGTTSTLTAEQKASYDAWPAGTKTYFDALTPARQQLFLRITDNDKAKLVALPASQQETVWASLEKQAASQATTSPTN